MIYLLITQIIVFITYVSYIWYNYSVLPSISESWYILPNNKKALFTLFCWGISIPLLSYGDILLFLSAAGLIITGTATAFKNKKSLTDEIHYIGASVGILFSILFFITKGIYIIPTIWLIGAILLLIFKVKNVIWWIEIYSFVLILIGLFEYNFF